MFNLIFNRIPPMPPSQADKTLLDWLRDTIFLLNNNFKKLQDTFSPISTIQKLVATDRISHIDDTVEVAGKLAATTLTSTPTISDGYAGERLLIIGTSDSLTVTFQDESNLTGSGLQLAGGADITLGAGDTLYLVYSATVGAWCEISRSNN